MIKKLPIEIMTTKEFGTFKRDYLDGARLGKEAIIEIRKLFNINTKKGNGIFHMYCDEFHPHTYKCLWYYKPISGVVERLIDEIEKYKSKVKEINEICKE